ncbi:MAG: SMP-30/gluconolactonase/LRE family protein, partial [Deltaproteobacteria bacterium]
MRATRLAIALAAAFAASASADEVHQFRRPEVDAAFARGAPLLENEAYKIHASRRSEPGIAEVHELDTDILYVREGSAVLVTGGSVREPHEIAPHEIRGPEIAGGKERAIAPGDVVTVPHGVPHWFKSVSGPLIYYVVKVTDGGRTAGTSAETPEGEPLAVVDLATREGVDLVKGTWRYHDAELVAAKHRAPDAEGQPTGKPVSTFAIEPRAGWADYDDSKWPAIAPDSLAQRRGNGRVSFGWYRIAVEVPDQIGGVATAGRTLVFETTVDDYAEVWVDGEIARGLGQRGGSVVAGWNAPNRLVIARNAKPGQRIQIALFGGNGPLSDPPANFVWVRSARLELRDADFTGPRAVAPQEVNIAVERIDAALDAIVPANPKLYKIAEGFQFTEGPVWVKDGGYLLFSDPNANRIYRYDPAGSGALTVFREHSGYEGSDIAEYGQPGSNGLVLDPRGRLVIAEHGRHRIGRLDAIAPAADETVLADNFEGRRLNSPNDLVYRSDGTLFFSDPPFGLPRFFDDPRKQLPWSGVYSLNGHGIQLATKDLSGPNGVAFSPDEKFLYVTNWDPKKKVVMRYEAQPDGTLRNGRVFFDMTSAPGEEALDGIEVDRQGNLYV